MAGPEVVCMKKHTTTTRPPVSYYMVDPSMVLTDPACTVVVRVGSEYGNGWDSLLGMSIADAEVIGLAVGVLWAVAWGVRAIRESFFN